MNSGLLNWKCTPLSNILLMSFFSLFIILCFANFVKAESSNPKIFSYDSSPFGTSFGNWIAKWWQWNVNIPLEGHPRDNFSTETCKTNQQGPVWFLPDFLTFAEEKRTCVIPSGKAVLAPIMTGGCWNDGNGGFFDDKELLACAKEHQNIAKEILANMSGTGGTELYAKQDGTELTDSEIKRMQSPYFNLTIPYDSYTRYDERTGTECKVCPTGTFRAMVDGYFLFLEPLEPGSYNFTLSFVLPPVKNQMIGSNPTATYNLIVEPPT